MQAGQFTATGLGMWGGWLVGARREGFVQGFVPESDGDGRGDGDVGSGAGSAEGGFQGEPFSLESPAAGSAEVSPVPDVCGVEGDFTLGAEMGGIAFLRPPVGIAAGEVF